MINETLEGFFNWQFLYDEMVSIAKDGEFIIEIGVWEGRSAVYLAEKIKESGKDITVIGIDPYVYGLLGNQGDANEMHRLEKLRKTVDQNGLSKILYNLVAKSEDAARLISKLTNGNKIAGVFIDGDHSFEGCAKDIKLYDVLVRKGGIVAGHDYTHGEWQGVVDAVNQYYKPKEFEVVDNIWISRK